MLKKKVFTVGLFLLLLFTLTSCDPGTIHYDYDELVNNVVEITLIDYDNPDRIGFESWVPDHSSDIKPFDFDKMTVLKTLPIEDYKQFLNVLTKAEILQEYYTYDGPNGLCIMLKYENGDFDIINSDINSYVGFIANFSPNGELIHYIGSFSGYYIYEILVEVFFDTQLPDELYE